MDEIISQLSLTSVLISGLVLLGVYLGALTLYRSLRNRSHKKHHRLPGD